MSWITLTLDKTGDKITIIDPGVVRTVMDHVVDGKVAGSIISGSEGTLIVREDPAAVIRAAAWDLRGGSEGVDDAG